jgi:hypothetical protein
MRSIYVAGAFALSVALSTPALADVVEVDASAIQGNNVLFNDGVQTGTSVTGTLNDAASTTVTFTGANGAGLRAHGGQARIEGALNLATQNPNDTLPLNGFLFGLTSNATFNNAEFNLFGGSATSVNFTIVDDGGQVFNFSKPLGNGENRFGFQAINGQSIRTIAFLTVGGGIADVRQIRLGLSAAPIPEPATWAMLIGGFAMAGAAVRRRGRVTSVLA